MAKRLPSFPRANARDSRRYPWDQWADGGAWEIRRGDDYDVDTEHMRTNLHVKADQLAKKVRTKKTVDDAGEGLVFQFYDPDPDAEEAKTMLATADKTELQEAMDALYHDAIDIYETARREVDIPRSDGSTQKYAAVRYRRQIEQGRENDELVPTIARIVRKPTKGFGHLEAADRPDLMLETLVLDRTKPYHRYFTRTTIDIARRRMIERGFISPDA